MMGEMKASIALKELSVSKTEVSMDIYYNTRPSVMTPLMKAMLKKEFGKMLIGLKYHLETGDLVTKNNIKQIMEGYEVIGPETTFEVYSYGPTLA